MKSQILTAIGEMDLQPAAALNAALAANDRIKYAFTLLQMAQDHARHPDRPAATLRRERLDCGIDDPDLDDVISGARLVGPSCRIGGAKRILDRIAADMRVMAGPVLAAKKSAGKKPGEIGERLSALLSAMPAAEDDLVDPEAISAMTQAGTHAGSKGTADSLHRLVMDLHKQLNALQADLAEETLDGAATYGLDDADRPLVAAFMAGVNRTAPLKFSHPGLATTATRAGGRLVIQNDIGTTDAHVIVIHIADLVVTVTYTDVHPERMAFFREMLKPQAVSWEDERTSVLAAGVPFYLASGRYVGKDVEATRAHLDFLGSRLVFLIDWNRARKQLRGFLRGPDRLALLGWAAQEGIGHRGFLQLGGARLVNLAIESTAGSAMHFGDRLCDVLGDAPALDFLRFVLQASTEGLRSGQSPGLIRDRIGVALATHFSNEEHRLLKLASDHAGLVFEIANLVSEALRGSSTGSGKRAKRARRYEHDADLLVIEARAAARRRPDYAVFKPLLEAADDAADELEDAVFLLDLDDLQGEPRGLAQNLADLVVEAAQEWIKALGHADQMGHADQIVPSGGAGETEDFLTAIDRVSSLEHQADDVERALTASSIQHAKDFRQLHLLAAIGGKLETAADALKHASLILRDHVLEGTIDG